MKPEEYPSETFCKYTNIVTGVLENFERMNIRSGSLKSYLGKKNDRPNGQTVLRAIVTTDNGLGWIRILVRESNPCSALAYVCLPQHQFLAFSSAIACFSQSSLYFCHPLFLMLPSSLQVSAFKEVTLPETSKWQKPSVIAPEGSSSPAPSHPVRLRRVSWPSVLCKDKKEKIFVKSCSTTSTMCGAVWRRREFPRLRTGHTLFLLRWVAHYKLVSVWFHIQRQTWEKKDVLGRGKGEKEYFSLLSISLSQAF